MVFINTEQAFPAREGLMRLKQPVSYKIFGLKSLAEVYRKEEGSSVVYICKLQYGGEIEVMKIESEWIDLQTDRPTSLSRSLGEGIERLEQHAQEHHDSEIY